MRRFGGMHAVVMAARRYRRGYPPRWGKRYRREPRKQPSLEEMLSHRRAVRWAAVYYRIPASHGNLVKLDIYRRSCRYRRKPA